MKTTKQIALMLGLLFAAGCGDTEKKNGGTATTSPKSNMQMRLSGSGSTFVKPIMDKWIDEYTKSRGGEINYQGQGSGAGVKQMIEQAVDFGCTDAFMKKEQLETAAKHGGEVVHIPLAMGAIAVAYNLPDVQEPINFTGEVLAEIFLGKIKKWNDPKLEKANKGIAFPDREIAVVHRSDSSGSTNIFTEYLCKVSPEWNSQVRSGTVVQWPCGIGENQTAGVAGAITKNPGSVGYIELYYALQNKITFGAVQNREGKFIRAGLASVSKAAEISLKEIPPDLRYSLTNAPGAESYPISGSVWAVFYTKPEGNAGAALVDFFSWVVHEGQSYAETMDYARLPAGMVQRIEAKLKQVQ